MKKMIRTLALVLILALSVCALASCAPASDPDKAMAALDKNGYHPIKLDGGSYEGCIAVVSGTKIETTGNSVVVNSANIYYFEDSKSANDAWEALQGKAEDDKKDDESNWILKKSGKMIYWGTKDGIAAAR